MRKLLATVAAGALLLGAGAAQAQMRTQGGMGPGIPSGAAPGAASGRLSGAEAQILEQVARLNAAGMQFSQLAEQNAASPALRAYAQRVAADEVALSQRLVRIGRESGLQLPRQPSAQGQQVIRRLESMRGPQFDREYVDEMRQVSQQESQLLAQAARQTRNPQLARLLQQTEAMDRMHVANLERMNTGPAGREMAQGGYGQGGNGQGGYGGGNGQGYRGYGQGGYAQGGNGQGGNGQGGNGQGGNAAGNGAPNVGPYAAAQRNGGQIGATQVAPGLMTARQAEQNRGPGTFGAEVGGGGRWGATGSNADNGFAGNGFTR